MDYEHNNPPAETPQHGGVDYEKKDVNILRLGLAFILAVIVVVAVVVAVKEVFLFESEDQIEAVVLKPQSVTLRELRANEDKELSTYAVIDSTTGTYRIPIDRAMELMADEDFQRRSAQKEK